MHSLIRRLKALAAILVVVTVASGCAESTRAVATGKGTIRGINAVVTSPELSFRIEERVVGTVGFKNSSSTNSYDDLTYNFNFDLLRPGDTEETRIASQFIDVLADHEYTVVLTGSIANPSTLFWEDPAREWAESETVSEIFFAHLAPSIGELDVYFAAPGTVPVLGQAVGSLANGERLPGMDFEEAQYEVILTPKDDPATIIYQSVPLPTTARNRLLVAVFDPDPSTTGNVGVNFITEGGTSAVLAAVNFPAQLRTLHATFGTENFDGYFDSDFGNIVYSDIGFKELSPYANVANSPMQLTLTPVGNSGAMIHEGTLAIENGSRRTAVLAGAPGALLFISLLDNGRPFETFPVARILNVSINTDSLDIYSLEPGTPIDEAAVPRIRGIPPSADTGFSIFREGMHELTVTLAGETTPIATPVILDLASGDVLDIVIVDTVDPAIVEIVIFDSL